MVKLKTSKKADVLIAKIFKKKQETTDLQELLRKKEEEERVLMHKFFKHIHQFK